MTTSKCISTGRFTMMGAALFLGLSAAPPEAAAVSFNGAEMNGRNSQGQDLNGRNSQGQALNFRTRQGQALNGRFPNVRSRQGVELQGPAVTDARGRPLGHMEVRNGRLVIRIAE